ncbi:MAG: DUF4293 domain-containing protein [Bacteroidales bacterium]|jgi:amino acid transporter|nr:DUF4293 domain-containing protein [Bacteroidales bacterium]
MLQRIQSVYLAIVAIACILLFFFPLATYYHELLGNYQFFVYGITCMDPETKVHFNALFTLPLIILVAISFILTIFTIFLYKKRLLQIRLCSINVLVNIILIMVIFFFYAAKIKTMTQIEPEYNYAGIIMPLISLIFLILASRAIRKDETLVKSSDRLR